MRKGRGVQGGFFQYQSSFKQGKVAKSAELNGTLQAKGAMCAEAGGPVVAALCSSDGVVTAGSWAALWICRVRTQSHAART